LLLSDIKACILVADRQLLGYRFEKSDLLVKPLPRFACVMKPKQPEDIAVKYYWDDEQRSGSKSLGKKP
jgi:hypothetical protein